jgi:DNA processing protein
MKSKQVAISEHPFLRPLLQLAKPPRTLFIIGELPTIRPVIAVVGTRRPTAYGKEVSFDLAYKLAGRGAVIVSGLAFGVDAFAHRGALGAGGMTIAVLAGGLDTIYPRAHQALAKQIVTRGGALVSEYPDGTPARKHHFLARNRLISGLSDAVIITEAAQRSGALSTVNHAIDQNKDVYAVPGPITSPLSAGPNRLIKEGASPLLDVTDIFPDNHQTEFDDILSGIEHQRGILGPPP